MLSVLWFVAGIIVGLLLNVLVDRALTRVATRIFVTAIGQEKIAEAVAKIWAREKANG